ncbi:MAG: hypothetical protein WD266_02335, partial [Balneolales bacterium]
MKMTKSIPALPVKDIEQAVNFYDNMLGFSCQYKDDGFARIVRDEVELHLWSACDKSWKLRSILLFVRPIWSGAESFLAGTASCRIEVKNINDLYSEYKASGVLYNDST